MPGRAPKTPKIARELLAARRLLARSLVAEPGILGVGIEAGEDDRPVLLVLVDAPERGRRVPSSFRGVDVTVRVSAPATKR